MSYLFEEKYLSQTPYNHIYYHDREKNTKYVRTSAPICKDRPVLIKFSFLLECKPITLKPLSESPLQSSRKPT